MNKLFLPLILAAMPLTASAQAIISGTIATGVEYERYDKDQVTGIRDLGSRLWIYGSEKLSGNTKVVYALNSFASTAGESPWAKLGTDDSYVGVRGDFGYARAGWVSSPLNYTGQDQWDMSSSTLVMSRFSRFGGRRFSLNYNSPDMKGFSFSAQLIPGSNFHKKDKKRKNDYVVGLGARYHSESGFDFIYANEYFSNKHTEEKYKDSHIHQMAVSYSKDKLYLMVGAQYAKNVAGSFVWKEGTDDNYFVNGRYTDPSKNEIPNASTQEYHVSGSYQVGSWTPKASVIYGKSSTGENYKQAIVGTTYALSKRTELVASAGWVKDKSDPHSNFALGTGIIHRLF